MVAKAWVLFHLVEEPTRKGARRLLLRVRASARAQSSSVEPEQVLLSSVPLLTDQFDRDQSEWDHDCSRYGP